MDAFWTSAQPADQGLFERFCGHLVKRTQINGNYYLPRFYPAMAATVIARLVAAGIHVPSITALQPYDGRADVKDARAAPLVRQRKTAFNKRL